MRFVILIRFTVISCYYLYNRENYSSPFHKFNRNLSFHFGTYVTSTHTKLELDYILTNKINNCWLGYGKQHRNAWTYWVAYKNCEIQLNIMTGYKNILKDIIFNIITRNIRCHPRPPHSSIVISIILNKFLILRSNTVLNQIFKIN